MRRRASFPRVQPPARDLKTACRADWPRDLPNGFFLPPNTKASVATPDCPRKLEIYWTPSNGAQNGWTSITVSIRLFKPSATFYGHPIFTTIPTPRSWLCTCWYLNWLLYTCTVVMRSKWRAFYNITCRLRLELWRRTETAPNRFRRKNMRLVPSRRSVNLVCKMSSRPECLYCPTANCELNVWTLVRSVVWVGPVWLVCTPRRSLPEKRDYTNQIRVIIETSLFILFEK